MNTWKKGVNLWMKKPWLKWRCELSRQVSNCGKNAGCPSLSLLLVTCGKRLHSQTPLQMSVVMSCDKVWPMGYKWKWFVQFLGCVLERRRRVVALSSCWLEYSHYGWRWSSHLDHKVEDDRATRWKQPRSLVTGEATMPGLTAKYTFM